MARKSTFSGGGGILNNSDGKITEIQFTTETPFANEGGYLYAAVTVDEDSREAPTTQFLFAGGTEEEFTITDDKRGVIPVTAGRKLGRGTAFAKLIGSIDATDHPGTLGDDEDVLDYSPVIGTRGRFMQEPLSAAELKKLPGTLPDLLRAWSRSARAAQAAQELYSTRTEAMKRHTAMGAPLH